MVGCSPGRGIITSDDTLPGHLHNAAHGTDQAAAARHTVNIV